MKAIFLLLLSLPILGGCEPRALTFAAIPWDTEQAEIREIMAERGFTFLAEANPRGDHLYAGSYAGHRAVVVARMAEGRLAKLEIGLKPPPGEELALFRDLQERLGQEYGEESGTVLREDGTPAEGWRSVPANLLRRRSVWTRTTRAGEYYLILENRPELAVVVSFESPAWHWEFLRRQPR